MAVEQHRDTDAERETQQRREEETAQGVVGGRQSAAARDLANRRRGLERRQGGAGRLTGLQLDDPLLQIGELAEHCLVLGVDGPDVRRVHQQRGEQLLVEDLLLAPQRLALRVERAVRVVVGALRLIGRTGLELDGHEVRDIDHAFGGLVLSHDPDRACGLFGRDRDARLADVDVARARVGIDGRVGDRHRPVAEQLAHRGGNVAGRCEEREPVETVARRSVGDQCRGGAERNVVASLRRDSVAARRRQPADRDRERDSDDDDSPVAPARPKDLADSHAPTLRLL